MKEQVAFLVTILYLSCVVGLNNQQDPERLSCIEGITRFSKRGSDKHFYDCNNQIVEIQFIIWFFILGSTNGEPILTACEDGLLYNMKKQVT